MKTRLTIALLAVAALLCAPAFAQNVDGGDPQRRGDRQGPGPAAAQGSLRREVRRFRLLVRRRCPSTWALRRSKRLAGSPAGKTPDPRRGQAGHQGRRQVRAGREGGFFRRGAQLLLRAPAEPHPHRRDREDDFPLGGRQELQPHAEASSSKTIAGRRRSSSSGR